MGRSPHTWFCTFSVLIGASCGVGSVAMEPGDDSTGGGSGNGARVDADILVSGQELGYPVGDTTTYPAGGWVVTQVLGHYWDAMGGRHLAQDIARPFADGDTAGEPVYSIGNGVVRYAGPNGSTYRNVVLIEHELSSGEVVCSFYGHITEPLVSTGQSVARGEQISTILDWAEVGGPSSNSHLHYVVLTQELCEASANLNGQLICGYDTAGTNDVVDLASEPARYQSIGDNCGVSSYGEAFISPSQLIEANR